MQDGDAAALGRPRGADGGLGGGDRHTRHVDAVALGQANRGGPVAAADVAHRLARGEVEPGGHEVDQRVGGRRPALAAGGPEAVVDVLAPDLAVERVELVVMGSDGRRGLGPVRADHLSRLTDQRKPGFQATSAETPASASKRCQSARRKLRATETMPSLRTIGCQRITVASRPKPQ